MAIGTCGDPLGAEVGKSLDLMTVGQQLTGRDRHPTKAALLGHCDW
jgi:hypothetical protein